MFIASNQKSSLAPLGATCHIALLTERKIPRGEAINMLLLRSKTSFIPERHQWIHACRSARRDEARQQRNGNQNR